MAANIKNYVNDLTWNVPCAQACLAGHLYGINSSGQAVTSDRHTGPIKARGFCVSGVSSTDATNGVNVALCAFGIVDFVGDTSFIAGGALTIGADVYLDVTGGITTTKPSTAGDLAQVVGFAMTATKVAFNIGAANLLVQAAGNSNVGI